MSARRMFRGRWRLPPLIWNHGAAPAWGFNGKDIPFRTVTLWNVRYK